MLSSLSHAELLSSDVMTKPNQILGIYETGSPNIPSRRYVYSCVADEDNASEERRQVYWSYLTTKES